MALISILFILLLIFGTPIVFSLGIAASFTIAAYDIPLALVAQRIYGGLDKFTIMAIPFFTNTLLSTMIFAIFIEFFVFSKYFNFIPIIKKKHN